MKQEKAIDIGKIAILFDKDPSAMDAILCIYSEHYLNKIQNQRELSSLNNSSIYRCMIS
ncbi:hypothetical protein VQL36_19170 [Chengkuizengella sp. SCS-71B]|uniref:hypothetical protein n=1 Tax=Chengkuizengella sp. SCS-71B TaxID=3115290 RepID=UPI0032C24A23